MENVILNNKQYKAEGTIKGNLKEVSVIDAPCGFGKTSWAIRYINGVKRPTIFVTPFLREVDRVLAECESMNSPERLNSKLTKLDSFKSLLQEGKNVATTHQLFKHLDEECYNLISDGGYELILDEVVTSVQDFPIKDKDITLLLNQNIIKASDKTGELIWLDSEYDGRFNDLQDSINCGDCYLVNISDKKMAIYSELSICKFIYFTKVTILTYLFVGSEMDCFFKINNIPYFLYGMKKTDNGRRGLLVPYDNHLENREALKELINVYDGKANDNFKDSKTALSANWYKNSKNKEQVKQMKKNCDSYMRGNKAHKEDILWSCYKEDVNSLKGSKCTVSKNKDDIEDGSPKYGFLAFNSRATNDYANTNCLAYPINIFCNPNIVQYFNHYGVEINQDLFAVSTLIQWVCRSAVREGKPVNLYLPSKRMRDLLNKFFDYEI